MILPDLNMKHESFSQIFKEIYFFKKTRLKKNHTNISPWLKITCDHHQSNSLFLSKHYYSKTYQSAQLESAHAICTKISFHLFSNSSNSSR